MQITNHTDLTDKAFSIDGPRAWNALPSNIKLISSRTTFRKKLEDALFQSHLVERLLQLARYCQFFFVLHRIVRRRWAPVRGAL